MQIDEIGSNKEAKAMDPASRQAEVRRMAQSMAAERLASAQAANQGQAVQQDSKTQEDAVKLSDKAVNQVGGSEPGVMNRRTQLRDSVLDMLNKEILDPKSDFNQKKKEKAEQGGDGGQKKKKVKVKSEWQPEAKPGQIHEGREVIGKIRVTKEVKEEGGEAGGAVAAAGQAGGAKGGAQAGAQQSDGKGQAVQPASESNAGKKNSDSPKEGAKEAKEAAAAQNMEKSGLKVEGMEQGGKGKEKAEEQSGAGGGSVKEFDVKGRSFGTTQTLTMKPAKELQPEDKSLGTFRKLDDKPMLKYVTLHSRNTDDAVQEMKKNASEAGESPEAIQQAAEKLRDRSQPDS